MKTWKQYIGKLAIITFLFTFSACDLFGDKNNNNNGNGTTIVIVEPLTETKWGKAIHTIVCCQWLTIRAH